MAAVTFLNTGAAGVQVKAKPGLLDEAVLVELSLAEGRVAVDHPGRNIQTENVQENLRLVIGNAADYVHGNHPRSLSCEKKKAGKPACQGGSYTDRQPVCVPEVAV